MADANDFQKAYLLEQRKLAKDIRPMIARSGMYNPDNDPEYVFQPFPETIKFPDGREIIVHNQDEKDAVLERHHLKTKPVEVDVAALVTEQQVKVSPVRRGRPPKVKAVDLPPNLE